MAEEELRDFVARWGGVLGALIPGEVERRALVRAVAEARLALVEAGVDVATPSPKRGRGRPKGSRTHTREAIVNRFRSLAKSSGRAPTQPELAANLEPKIEVRTLQEHLTAYGLSWPIE